MVIQMRWWIGFQLLVYPCGHVLDGGSVTTDFATSRTVSIPKSSTVDDQGVYREVT